MKARRPFAVIIAVTLLLTGCSMEDFSLANIGKTSLSNIGEKIGNLSLSGIGDQIGLKSGPLVELSPAPAPIYAVGDIFVYSNHGTVVQEKVVNITADRVTWTNDKGMIWTTSNLVITPLLSWSSHPELGRGRQAIIGNPKSFFPLKEGNTVAFGIRGNSENVPTGWRDEHRCQLLGQKDINVSGGEFTTFHISCQRKDHREDLYYSPSAQNYVLRVRTFAKTQRRKDLPTKVDRSNAKSTKKNTKNNRELDRKLKKSLITSGNNDLDALILRLETIIRRLERLSGNEPALGKTAQEAKSLTNKTKKRSPKSAGLDGKYGAHLASYRTKKSAARGWKQLSKKFPKKLKSLKFGTTEFDPGNGKGIYIRLVALSFKTKLDSFKFCKQLKVKRQFCQAIRVRP